MTRIAGVTGHPIRHSLSPVIHTAWIQALGLDAHYQLFDAPTEDGLRELAHRIRSGDLVGLNVTAPYKLEALAVADRIFPAALACGSANLLTSSGQGQLCADNTHAIGLLAALDEQAPHLTWADLSVVVLGAGGAARSAAQAVRQRGAELTIVNRTEAKARELATAFGGRSGSLRDLVGADLVINASSHMPSAHIIAALKTTAVVMDMTYRPLMTPLLQAASDRGLAIVDGLAMLIGQARPSFTSLFEAAPPDMDVRAVALAALGAQA